MKRSFPNVISCFAPHERLPEDRNDGNGVGVIALANEARFTVQHFSEPLTNYALGWKDPNNIEMTLDFLFPPVMVNRRFEYKSTNNAEQFYSETDDLRAIGADFKRVEYQGTTINDKTINKGLTVRLDRDEIDEIPGMEEATTARLLQRVLRNELRRAVTAAAAAAAANNTAKTWDTSAGKDPDQDVLTEIIAGVDASGIRTNRLLYGDIAWNKRSVSLRAQNLLGQGGSSVLTQEGLAGFFGVDKIVVSRERYSTSSTAKGKVTPDIVLFFYGQDNAGKDDPSHTKRFWTPVDGGGKYRVYRQEVGAKFIDITVEHYSNCSVTTSNGLRKFTIS